MSLHHSLHRRRAIAAMAGSVAAMGMPAIHAAGRRVRYVLGIPTLSPLVANQTSIPEALGFYAQEGVAVEPVLAGAGGTSGAVQMVASGDQDIGSGSYTPLLGRAGEGQDLGVSFFYLQVRSYAMALTSLADSPVTAFSGLKGKTVGVSTLGSESAAVAKFVARSSGMAESDIQLIAVGAGAQSAQALRSRQIDAYLGPKSQIAQIDALGLKLKPIPLPERLNDLFGPGLYARRDFIEKNRAVVVGIGRAVARSTLFAMTNPEAAIRLHWKAFPQQLPQSIPFEQALANAMQAMKVQIEGLRFQDNEPNARFGEFPPRAIDALVDVYGLRGRIQNPTQLFSNELVAEMNQFDRDKVVQQARAFKA